MKTKIQGLNGLAFAVIAAGCSFAEVAPWMFACASGNDPLHDKFHKRDKKKSSYTILALITVDTTIFRISDSVKLYSIRSFSHRSYAAYDLYSVS
ncbi:hypothetical protein [Bifidobacterium felsineum]|uniref:hypothetical protein n=1 Tax=Bifidobacterium felsineum TaxID=2045440 RepID=UPI001BDDA654|nr:hypothetical protein [Bifidobacterium felsineum]MBT1164302.1 hypothetical protein [Bifidobacterium felsineum]